MRTPVFLLVLIMGMLNSCKDADKKSTTVVRMDKSIEEAVVSSNGYEDLEGNPVDLSDYKGKRILLNFWATWCRPCVEEMPSLLKAEEILEKENYVVLLATDQSVKIINSFKERKGFEFTYIRYTGAFADLGIKALPKTFVYNEEGKKVDEISGALEWDSPETIERLKSLD
ncbi:TlpA family protein disulfide reductase [Maribacter sp. HTCC2170]|uniref:TlpA family protein disulfide reductase n=1 Tax=Maribacter sp. (strain HTCC2170 / KCCM 42371) TaxID=313603 RepID=UPI000319E63F|nr:TlpA disulfide reductase family protein [Maribacter sp. HTCC2170]